MEQPCGSPNDDIPLGPDSMVPAELIVSCNADSLDQGLNEQEIMLINVSMEQAKKQGKKLLVRFRLLESEEQIVQRFGNGDKNKATEILSQKVKTLTSRFR